MLTLTTKSKGASTEEKPQTVNETGQYLLILIKVKKSSQLSDKNICRDYGKGNLRRKPRETVTTEALEKMLQL